MEKEEVSMVVLNESPLSKARLQGADSFSLP